MNCFIGIRLSILRLTMASLAPCSANALAIPPVIPVPPPVTNATLPCKIFVAKILSVILRKMLPHYNRRGDLHDQGEQIPKRAYGRSRRSARNGRPYAAICLVSFCLIASLCAVSCGSKAVDVRTLTPGDALVYLGSKDLSQAIGALVESKS